MTFLQNIASWIGSTAPTVGQKAMAASLPVVVANDQSTLNQNLESWLGSTAPTVGQKTTAQSIPFTLASDQPTINVLDIINGTTYGARDAFRRWRTSAPATLFDSKQIVDNQPLIWDDQQTSGAGTSTSHSAVNARTRISVGNLTAGTRVRQTFRRFNYQPGKSQLIFMTFAAEVGAAGITRRVGQFDSNNGVFFQQSGTTLSWNIRTQSGAGAQSKNQIDWNIDPLNGAGRSGIDLALENTQIAVIDYEWLGVGLVRVGFVIDGEVYYCHQFQNANNLATVYMSNPNNPLRYEISNDGSGPAAFLDHICGTVISEGGRSDTGQRFSANRGATSVTTAAATRNLLIAIRLKSTHLSATIIPTALSVVQRIAGGNNAILLWRMHLNPTFSFPGGGTVPAWTSITNSAVEYAIQSDTAANFTINANGNVFASGYFPESVAPTLPNVPEVALGSTIAGVSDIFALSLELVDGTGDIAFGSLGWSEAI